MNSTAPTPSQPPVRVAAFYCFTPVADTHHLAAKLRSFGAENGLKGSIIIAQEGANGTISGHPDTVDALFTLLREEPGFQTLTPRLHTAPEMPFARWKVKVKREIVTMGIPVDAANGAGTHVSPADWNALIADPDVILVDTRNDYEVAIGTFAGAIDPGTANFGDFPSWFDAQTEQWCAEGRKPRIAMFCTGGIRCEKSTAYARARGFDDVYHLKGGILAYLAEIEAQDSQWQGECFLFDERISITHGESSGNAYPCEICGQPVASSTAHDCGASAGS
jgi:UPF0176 protein